MRSSTSSSDERLPRGGWGRTWGLTLAAVLVVLGGLEIAERSLGYYPQVYAADESWILEFARIKRATTVVLGTSRIQAALEPDAYQQVMGGPAPVNLALPGGSPLPVLEYLADSTDYRGLVIAEILPLEAFDATQAGATRGLGLIRRYEHDRVSPASMSEDWLRVHFLQYFVFRSPELLPAETFKRWRTTGALRPKISVLHMRPDRFGPIYQQGLRGASLPWDAQRGFYTVNHHIAERSGRVPTSEELQALETRYNRAASAIQARGGKVAFVYLSACGSRLEVEERRYPRSVFWDVFARTTPAIAIASQDIPRLNGFDCYDGSHIDAADAPAYSRALATAIRSRLAVATR